MSGNDEITIHGTTWEIIRNQVELKLENREYRCILCDRIVSADEICLHIITGEREGYVCRDCWKRAFETELEKERNMKMARGEDV